MTHHNIVAIEAIHCPIPAFTLPNDTTYTLSTYPWTAQPDLHARIKDATIIITTTIRLTASEIDPSVTPNLRLIVVMGTGNDHVDKAAAAARGIPVCNTPSTNIASVSEHAIGLYFAGRRKLIELHRATSAVPEDAGLDTEWKMNGSLHSRLRMKGGRAPLLCSDETMGIVGFGALGKRIAKMAEALGMKVLVAGRKGATEVRGGEVGGVERVPFEEVLQRSTVVVLCLPRNPETLDLVSLSELKSMRPEALLINVARGGIVNEAALLEALREGWIAGAAADVFATEPAGKTDSPLLGPEAAGLNLTLTPHLAWFAEETLRNLQSGVKETVEKWCAGETINRVG